MKHRTTLVICMFGLMAFMCIGASGQSNLAGQDLVSNANQAITDGLDVPAAIPGNKFSDRRHGDSLPSPQSIEQNRRRQEALQQRLAGKGSGKVQQIAKGQYVQMQLEGSDKIFAIIVEYGNQAGTGLSTTPGPLHNKIPEPDRAVDNNTIWQADYSKAHYEQLFNRQMADYYQAQSSGRYTVNGVSTEWVKVPFNGSRYGANSLGDASAWTLIADAINIWTQDRLSEGMTIDQITDYLKTFDKWDRYDYNGNGNFNEPDGYIDHFMIIHAGEGEETGGGTLGADAIWSHRWFAFYTQRGSAGPSFNKYGGLEFGGGWGANPAGITTGSGNALVGPSYATVTDAYPVNHTGIFVGDYTIEPENGGLGVFAHEFTHDLGIPDHYDTSSGGTNSIAFWNIMANGSYLGDGTVDIGSRPGDMTAWDKFQLGWLNYEVAYAGKFSSHRLGPAETNTKTAQGLFVVLPKDKNIFYLFSPTGSTGFFGTKGFWSGNGDMQDHSMTRQLVVPAAPAVLTMQLNYQIESNWDYAYIMVSADNGATWSFLRGTYVRNGVPTAITTCTNPNNSTAHLEGGCGITGSTSGAWRLASFDMSAFAGQAVLLRLRYMTDENTNYKGLMVDDITLGTFSDGAEGDTSAWTFGGFKVSTGIEVSNANHYYLAEYRQYRDYDSGLQTGPYTFGYAERPDYVAHYPYQDGLLITYWDTGMTDDNTSVHPGERRSLVIDAHPDPLIRTGTWPNGTSFASAWSNSLQSYDATFGLQATDALHLPFVGSYSGQRLQFWSDIPSLPPATEFNDMNSYWSATTPTASVIVPKTGTIVRVVSTSAQDGFMQVHVDSTK